MKVKCPLCGKPDRPQPCREAYWQVTKCDHCWQIYEVHPFDGVRKLQPSEAREEHGNAGT